MKEENFTSSQVGALLESMDQKIDLIAEAVAPLREDMFEVKERLTKVETRLTHVEDAVRISLPSLNKRVERLEKKVGI